MYKIIRKKRLNSIITAMIVEAQLIAKKVQPGQFIILRVNETGERIPLTVSDCDPDQGTITIIFQKAGKTTVLLDSLDAGEYILDVVGPLGLPTHLEGYQKTIVIGGGAGCAIAFPQAKALFHRGAQVDIIAGFRSKELIILEDEMKDVSSSLCITTDDGSNGVKGFVTDKLKLLLETDQSYDLVIAIGPLPMMKAVSALTREYGIKTIVSLNPIMIDGTGMCGGCRVKINGQVKFACIDGPDFDGHEVDFDDVIRRTSMYRNQEKKSHEQHVCNLGGIENA